MVKRFLASGRTGFHVAVLREGEVGAGDQKLEIRKVKLENGEEKIRTLPDGVPDQVGAGGVNADRRKI
ncbi:MAG TPA: hypothetical protein VOA64_13465 [Candidatus Dormibacteraeota bacterium]|nr:hypothetical protein [Candidatus Dormibacteraeota bacterium]